MEPKSGEIPKKVQMNYLRNYYTKEKILKWELKEESGTKLYSVYSLQVGVKLLLNQNMTLSVGK